MRFQHSSLRDADIMSKRKLTNRSNLKETRRQNIGNKNTRATTPKLPSHRKVSVDVEIHPHNLIQFINRH